MRRDHSSSDIALVGDPPGGVESVEQSGRRPGRPRHAWSPGRGRRPSPGARPAGPGSGRSCRSSRAHRDRSRRLRQFQQGKRVPSTTWSHPSGTSSAVSSRSFRARTITSVMTPMAREIVGREAPSCSPITACITLRLSHQNRWLRGRDRRGGAGGIGRGWRLNRSGFDGGGDDRKDHCYGTQGSTRWNCASG